jgi:hypothetical protein
METFMVRVWTPDGDDWAPGVRGTATHLASGREVTFTEAAALIAFLEDPDPPGGESGASDRMGRRTKSNRHARL